MKRAASIAALAILVMALVSGGVYAQQSAPAQGGWHCPWMGQGYGTQGSQRGWGYMPCYGSNWGSGYQGKGMMHRGYTGQQQATPLSENQARRMLEDYLSSGGNPNLKLGDITEKNGLYEAQILTMDGSLVDKIQVNKDTGWFRSAF